MLFSLFYAKKRQKLPGYLTYCGKGFGWGSGNNRVRCQRKAGTIVKDAITKIEEQKILEAIERGELDNLPGKGKPLVFEDDSFIPEDLRAGYKVMKNSGVLPVEMDVKKQIALLEQMIADCRDAHKKEELRQQLMEQRLHYNIMMDKRKR
jgi:hypothetical protein